MSAAVVAQTCAGRCNIVPNNCGNPIDCGPCACTPACPMCQTCNASTGQCVALANTTPCNDGDACTQTDTCQSGVCVGTNPVVCTPLDACHVAGTCNPATGVCSNPNAADRTSCGGSNICCGGACCSGCCGSTGACGACLAFVTSTTDLDGNLGGLAGADAICQQLADTAGLAGGDVPDTYLAWRSDATGSPSSRFRQSQMPYQRVDDVVIANTWGDLTDGFLANPIAKTEQNVTVNQGAWTNTAVDGTPATADQDCADWTSTSGSLAGRLGFSNETNSGWTNGGTAITCSSAVISLFCFQQR